jgi:hypothetical protein
MTTMPSPGRSIIENHSDRGRIEHDIAAGVPGRVIARKYGLSRDSIQRHAKKMPPQLRTAKYTGLLRAEGDLEKLRIEESEGLLAGLAQQRARLLLMQDMSIELADADMVGRMSAQIHRNLELVGKYLGEFASRSVQTNVSLLITPEYLTLRSALVQALRPFPDARAAVAAVLHRIEGDAAQRGSQAAPHMPPMIDATPVREAVHA